MEPYEAIFKRKSTRQYSTEPLTDDEISTVEKIVESADRLKDTGLKVHIVRDGKVVHELFKGIISNYTKVIAPHYLVVTSDDVPGWRENSGYTVEQIVLELTRIGLATCWIGGHADRESLKTTLGVDRSRVAGVFIAFGKPAVEGDQYRKDPGDAKRKPLAQIVTGQPDETWTTILEAARIAPSAVNSQPWRFFIEPDRVDLCIVRLNPVAQRLYGALTPVDAGIVLKHVVIAAAHLGLPVTVKEMPVAEKKDHFYVTSILKA